RARADRLANLVAHRRCPDPSTVAMTSEDPERRFCGPWRWLVAQLVRTPDSRLNPGPQQAVQAENLRRGSADRCGTGPGPAQSIAVSQEVSRQAKKGPARARAADRLLLRSKSGDGRRPNDGALPRLPKRIRIVPGGP